MSGPNIPSDYQPPSSPQAEIARLKEQLAEAVDALESLALGTQGSIAQAALDRIKQSE